MQAVYRSYVRELPWRPTLRHHKGMSAGVWRRIGWGFFIAAVVGIAAYMASVGWNKANLIAGIGAFFVAVAGLALAVRPPVPSERGGVHMRMRKVRAGNTAAERADVPAGTPVLAEMHKVSGRNVWEWIRAHARPADAGDEDDHDG